MLLTYEQQLNLVDRKLATVSVNGIFSTFKYAKRVMIDYLWDKYPEVHECRGHTYNNQTGELVLASPTKSFNYLENGWWKDVTLYTEVRAYRKFNGFMATVTMYNGEVIVGTTGSTKSDYAKLAQEVLMESSDCDPVEGMTDLFEIIHESDPHIVDEKSGAKFLGYRDNTTGKFVPYTSDKYDSSLYYEGTLAEVLELSKGVKHEGYMVYLADGDNSNPCKVKTPYYTYKKKLMRMNKTKVKSMYQKNLAEIMQYPSDWQEVVGEIVGTVDILDWQDYTDQERRTFIETIKG